MWEVMGVVVCRYMEKMSVEFGKLNLLGLAKN